MGGVDGGEDKDHVLLKNLRVELAEVNHGVEEGSGFFSLFFWLYIENYSSLPSAILAQRQENSTSWVPFLCLDEKKKMKLFPLVFVHKEAPDLDNYVLWSPVPVASTEAEFPMKKWVHIGCQVVKDFVRLFVDGKMVGEKNVVCLVKEDEHPDIFKKLDLVCPHDDENLLHGFVHGLDIMLPTSPVKEHLAQDPPLQLVIDHLSASEIEDDSGDVWSVVGGKASCRRIFSFDVTLSDVLGCVVNKELEVLASLLYADNDEPVENNSDGEPPLLASCDGIEYASWDRPAKLSNGRASFKLKISQLSSKCENRMFRIKFTVPGLGSYPFLETLSPPIHCVSRNRNVRTAPLPWRRCSNKIHDSNGCQCPATDDRSADLIPNIVREAKPSPSSKRIKLGHDNTFSMFREAANAKTGTDRRSRADTFGMSNVSSPVSDSVVFKYCLGGTSERFQLLKELALSASEEQIAHFAKQVSIFSGCSHHRHQIGLAKRLVEEGIQAWTCISENNSQTLWENLAIKLNECFMKIACCDRPLLDRDLECLRRIAGHQEIVSLEVFEKIWAWLYPVAFTLSRGSMTPMWDSLSPLWMEGFITKEKAESILQGPYGLQEPGTFILRFPTSRSWPHPDAGNLVITYVGSDSRIHHRLVSFDFIESSSETARPLQDFLLEEPELSKLGRMKRNH